VKELAVELRERPVVIGPRGALILDAFKHVEDFIANYRENIKELLESEPHAIPGYHLESQNRNVLSRNAALVYEKLAALVELSAEDFLAACTPSIGGLTKLLETHEGMLPEEINHTLEQALGNQQLLALEITHRLVREREDRP
jgi:hypothetical protein